MKIKLLLLFLVLFALNAWAQPKNVLFIGNSITASGIPDMFREISLAKGKPVQTDFYWNGQLLREYVKDSNSVEMLRNKLNERKWDYVVLQENSAVSGFYPGYDQGYFEFYSYQAAKRISKVIREENPCTEVVFFMTYGYINGDKANFPDDTYLKMQTRIRRNYKLLADSNSAIVAPVGMAWKQIRTNEDWYTELYASPEDHHPGQMGIFLAACVFYASIFADDPSNSGYSAGIDPVKMLKLEEAAKMAVLDSIDTWNLRINVPFADFTFERNHKMVNFTSLSQSTQVAHKWYFGDGDSSQLSNPVHTYLSDNTYIVTHVVASSCYNAKSSLDTVEINTSFIMNNQPDFRIMRQADGHFQICYGGNISAFRVVDLNGKEVTANINESGSGNLIFDLNGQASGIYIVRIIQDNRSISIKIIN